ncbi:hypothetical protein CEXT_248521, partial [Caerostris extrusa]
LRKHSEDKPASEKQRPVVSETTTYNAVTAPPMVPPPIIPPTNVTLPMLLTHPMQPQFGLHLTNLLPPQAMVMQVPMGIPPPNPMLMVQQQSLGNQNVPLVGGVPPLVQRNHPNITSALTSIKNAVGESTISSLAGDATPTEEDGTSVSSPGSIQKSVPSSVSSASVNSTPASQFGPLMNLPNANRLRVPPPVSTSGAPIPYPPPHNVGFNFPPPGMRPPNMGPNSQMPWMQKHPGSPFTESDSNQSRPGPGMPPHMFNSRPPFHELPSKNSPMKDNNRDMERRPGEMESSVNRSPMHPDKMPQEMVISTDDESSMDRDYPHNEMKGPRFPAIEFPPRMPMNMHRMRSPMGPMQGPRFPPSMPMGSPFPPRMGGPRGPGMHPGLRMEMEFPPFVGGPRGPRMPGLPPGPRRMDGPHHPNEGREWYPRDFEGPLFDRDRHFFNERNRDQWVTPESLEGDSRHAPRNHDRHDDRMRDIEKRDGPSHQGPNVFVPPDKQLIDDGFNARQRPRPGRKPALIDEYDDMFKMNFYQRDIAPSYQYHLNTQPERRRSDIPNKSPYKNDDLINKGIDQSNNDNVRTPGDKAMHSEIEQDTSFNRRDRESRKRSRWGRTLSEEREFQQQKRNEIEMKFQSYEQSAQAAQFLQPNSEEISSNEKSENVVEMATSNVDFPTSSDSLTELSESATLASDSVIPDNELPVTDEPNTMQSPSETFSANQDIEPSSSRPFENNPSELVTNSISESVDSSLMSEHGSVSMDSDPSVSNLDSESVHSDKLLVMKKIDESTVSNSNAVNIQGSSLSEETLNHIDSNSNNNTSEISSTNDSPLLSAES